MSNYEHFYAFFLLLVFLNLENIVPQFPYEDILRFLNVQVSTSPDRVSVFQKSVLAQARAVKSQDIQSQLLMRRIRVCGIWLTRVQCLFEVQLYFFEKNWIAPPCFPDWHICSYHHVSQMQAISALHFPDLTSSYTVLGYDFSAKLHLLGPVIEYNGHPVHMYQLLFTMALQPLAGLGQGILCLIT